jgi:hypothetical protein
MVYHIFWIKETRAGQQGRQDLFTMVVFKKARQRQRKLSFREALPVRLARRVFEIGPPIFFLREVLGVPD